MARRAPELVTKRYLLEWTEANKKNLQARVSLKETLNWEIEDANWKMLVKQFPELGVKNAVTSEERLNALDSLDDITRNRVEQFARAAIVDSHPEWIAQALAEAAPKKEWVAIRLKGGHDFFKGLKNNEELMQKLDQGEKFSKVTFDNNAYYNISILEREPGLQVVTFGAAKGPLLDAVG